MFTSLLQFTILTLLKDTPSSNSKVCNIDASLSISEGIPLGNFILSKLRILLGRFRPVIAVPEISISLISGDVFNLRFPPSNGQLLRLSLFRYVCGDKFALLALMSANNGELLASNSINLVALPINIRFGFIDEIPNIRLILEPPYIRTSWSVAAIALPVNSTLVLPSIFFLSIWLLYHDRC